MNALPPRPTTRAPKLDPDLELIEDEDESVVLLRLIAHRLGWLQFASVFVIAGFYLGLACMMFTGDSRMVTLAFWVGIATFVGSIAGLWIAYELRREDRESRHSQDNP